MRAKTQSPHNILSVTSALLTIGLLTWAIVIGDGPAAIVMVFLASATAMFCAAALWSPPARPGIIGLMRMPAGDVVIRTKEGAFLIIKCDRAPDLGLTHRHVCEWAGTGAAVAPTRSARFNVPTHKVGLAGVHTLHFGYLQLIEIGISNNNLSK